MQMALTDDFGAEGFAGEKVQVKVRDFLAAVGSGIGDEAEAGGGDVEFTRDFGGGDHQVAEQGGIGGGGLPHVGEVILGNDDDMDRGLGVDVVEGEAVVVLVDDLGGNLSPDDFAENGGVGVAGVAGHGMGFLGA